MAEYTSVCGTRLEHRLRLACAGILAGMIVGVAGGIGSRVVMRVVALAAGHDPAFSLTGTLGVVFFGFLIGMPMGLFYAAAKPFLPGHRILKGLVYGVVFLPLFGFPIAVGNEELTIAPRLGLVLYSVLFIASGVLLAAVEKPIERRMRVPEDHDDASAVRYGCVLVLGAAGTLFFALAFIAAITGASL